MKEKPLNHLDSAYGEIFNIITYYNLFFSQRYMHSNSEINIHENENQKLFVEEWGRERIGFV